MNDEKAQSRFESVLVLAYLLIGVIQVIFAVLRLFEIILWPWILVFLPLILLHGIELVILIILWLVMRPVKNKKN